MPLLSLLVFLPLLGALAVLLVPKHNIKLMRVIAVVATGAGLILSAVLLCNFDHTSAAVQFSEKALWIPQINVNYFLGVDGLSVTMVFLTGLLGFLALLASWGITSRQKEYFFFYLLL